MGMLSGATPAGVVGRPLSWLPSFSEETMLVMLLVVAMLLLVYYYLEEKGYLKGYQCFCWS